MMSPRWSTIFGFLALSVVFRLIPFALLKFDVQVHPETTTYPWNFSPILPICLFGGAMYTNPRAVYVVPWATYLLGDLGIWALTGRLEWALYANQPVVYLSLALVASTGFLVRGHHSWRRIVTAGVLASTVFFVVTNFGVWAFGDGTLYPKTVAGLVECYFRAIPYYRNTLVSMVVFLPILFSRLSLIDVATASRMTRQYG